MIVLTISDLHAPFQHKDAISFLKELKRIYKPDQIVCQGDEIDFHTLSQWPKDPDGLGTQEEFEKALDFLRILYVVFPEVKVCTSNHTARPLKLAFRSGLPKAFVRDYADFLRAPKGWEWNDKWVIENVEYFHGEGVGSGVSAYKNCVDSRHRSCSIGHLHSYAGVVHFNSPERRFILNTGCLLDSEAYAFHYGKNARVKPSIGTGIVIHGKTAIWEPLC